METFNTQTKAKYVKRAVDHRKADNIIQDFYWDGSKGCCVGCLAHSSNYPHKALEEQTGIPEWISRVADDIHEYLPDGEFQKWPEQFIKSIPVGVSEQDLELKIKAPFIVFVLKSTLENFDHKKYSQVKGAVDGSIGLWEREDIGSGEWNAARSAAYMKFRDELVRLLEAV